MSIDLRTLERYKTDGLIASQVHPVLPLTIYNYTPAVQYGRLWDEVTMQCRGLVLDDKGEIVARPFSKFFNLEELSDDQLPNEPFEVFDKMDGSLGILFFFGDEWHLATRGSFDSEQAKVARMILRRDHADKLGRLNKSFTYLFEIIYPMNRIVVDYGSTEILVMLAVIDTETGLDQPLPDVGFPKVRRYDAVSDFRTLKAMDWKNSEGFVVKFKSGFRCKIKFEEYVRLHRILTNVSNVTIWEYLSSGKPLDELLDRVPDEFYRWMRRVERELMGQYTLIELKCKRNFKELATRKECALYYQTQPYPSVLFNMLDGKPYDHIIWKSIRPTYSKPFAIDNDK